MSLDANWTACKDYALFEGDEKDKERRISVAIIFGTMSLGLNAVTEDNIDEWLVRMAFVDAGAGLGYLDSETLDRHCVTEDDLRKRIGLKTNATPKARSVFLRLEAKLYEDRLKRQRKYEKENAAKAAPAGWVKAEA